MSNRIAVVGEAAGDFAVARELIDQTILRCVGHVDESVIDSYREYVGPSQDQPFVVWGRLDASEPKDYRLAVRGRFGLSDPWPNTDIAIRIRRAIFDSLSRASDAFVVIVKDTDNDDARCGELRQVAPLVAKMPVVLGIQHTEQECWLLAGFHPESAEETDRLGEIQGGWPPGVGFNPCEKSHQLTATKKEQEKLSPKRVLRHLTGEAKPNSGPDLTPRAKSCLHRDRHAAMRQHGTQNGAADFLRDIEQQLVRTLFNIHTPEH